MGIMPWGWWRFRPTRPESLPFEIDLKRPRLPTAFTLFPGVAHHRNRHFKILAVFLAHLLCEFIPLFRRDGPGRNRRLAISRPGFICSHAMKIDPSPVVVGGG